MTGREVLPQAGTTVTMAELRTAMRRAFGVQCDGPFRDAVCVNPIEGRPWDGQRCEWQTCHYDPRWK